MIFLNSAISAAALVFYLPGVCTQTDTEGKQRKARVRNILKKWEKTQYSMDTLYLVETRASSPPCCSPGRVSYLTRDISIIQVYYLTAYRATIMIHTVDVIGLNYIHF